MKTVLVTGATSGIGKATCEKFAQYNYKVIITGRRTERLHTIKTMLQEKYKATIEVLPFDITSFEETEKAFLSLPDSLKEIDILVNNAGLAAGLDPIDAGSLDDWERMIDTNIKGLLYISKMVIPHMKKAHRGHIFNIGSTAGKEVYPKGNVYCATKHAVDALTKSMRIDLLPYNIKVTGICPGMVETEFSEVRFKGDPLKSEAPYEGITPLYGNDIADIIYFAATCPTHVTINDLVVTCTQQANSYIVNRETNF